MKNKTAIVTGAGRGIGMMGKARLRQQAGKRLVSLHAHEKPSLREVLREKLGKHARLPGPAHSTGHCVASPDTQRVPQDTEATWRLRRRATTALLYFLCAAWLAGATTSGPAPCREQAMQAERLMKDGQFQQAYELAGRVLVLARKHGTEDIGSQFLAEYVMGKCEQGRGQLSRAEQHLLNAVGLCRTTPSNYAPEAVLPLMELGVIYQRLGRYGEAEHYLLKGLSLRVRISDRASEELAAVFEAVGAFYLDAGDPNRAETYLLQAHRAFVESLGADHPRVATTLDLTGRMNRLLGEYALSERCFQGSLEIRSRARGTPAGNTAGTLHLYSALKASQSDFVSAYQLQTQALQQLESLPGVPGGTLAAHLNNLGFYALALSRTDEARRLLTRARDLSVRHDGPRGESVGNTGATLAMIELRAGRITEALSFLAESQAIYTERLLQVERLGTEDQMQDFMAKIQGKTDLALECGAVASNNAEAVRFAYETLLRRKSVLAESVSKALRVSRQRSDADAVAARKRLAELRSELSHMALVGQKPMDREEASRLFGLERDLADVQRKLAWTGRPETRDGSPYAAESAHVAATLPDGSVLVEYAIFRRADPMRSPQDRKQERGECAAFVLLPDGRLVMRLLGRVSDIEPNLHALRATLTRPGIGNDPDAAATATARQLIHPLSDLLVGARRVIFAPDGMLYLLPFSVLPDPAGNALFQKHAVVYVNTGRDLVQSSDRPSAGTPPVVVARPSYDRLPSEAGTPASGMRFSDLPGTGEEAAAVAGVLRGARILDGDSASEANVKGLRSPAVLHIATHGFFLDTAGDLPGGIRGLEKLRPRVQRLLSKAVLPDFRIYSHPFLRCGLALADANRFPAPGEDGILSAMEVLDMDLAGTELAVLSACETGIGATVDGSGVFGLRRAFLEAGTGAQVLSLWKVHDQATCMLMTRFYEHLLKGLDKGEALRGAQQAVRDGRPEWKHPFFWAAFVVSGDWRPLRYPSAGVRGRPQ